MKNNYYLLLFVLLLTSCSNVGKTVDGIQYENLRFSDSVVLINGQKRFLDIDVDYPIGSSIEATNIREYIMSNITMWFFQKQRGKYLLSNENLIDSLHLWTRFDTIDKKSERLIKVKAVRSGVEGIATFGRSSFVPDNYLFYNSMYVKTGEYFILPIDSVIIHKFDNEIRRQKDFIIEHGFLYELLDEHWPPIEWNFSDTSVRDSMVSFFYDCDSLNNPFYISIPFSEIKDRLPDWK